MPAYDLAIVGGGLVGLATAHRLLEAAPSLRLALLEKEAALGQHQSSHNSGVVHSGVYYRPGSLKARLCREGARDLEEFAARHAIPYRRCGKLVVAVRGDELPRLEQLARTGRANGLDGIEELEALDLARYEPHVSGVAGLWVPQTGVIDYPAVAAALAEDLRKKGADVLTGCRLRGIDDESGGLSLSTGGGRLQARRLVNCAGLHSDRVCRLAGQEPGLRIIPFRGDYFRLRGRAVERVRGLVYPVPDPDLPFLGVHLTRHIGGEVTAGPNAVLALKREGYRRTDFDLRELVGMLRFRGFRGMLRSQLRLGLGEAWRDLSRRAYARSLRPYLAGITAADLDYGPAGVRAQAVRPNGRLVDDFVIVEAPNSLHVLNAPSPAATASLAIGRELAGRALEAFAGAWAEGRAQPDPNPA